MTDKELAKESWWNDNNCSGAMSTEKIYECGFLAGLKAGRPKWHKVAGGDLPKDENDVLVYSGEDWRMCVGRYFPKYKAWEAGCDTIAWCEIPKYTEE
ncbi:MAG: hypothetical protein J6W60_04610 [Treponema sp.]|nr:hypothetical protein [Paludibacteraceae bacterium]MBP5752124.1 hypothetical protein [Treponema sp.]